MSAPNPSRGSRAHRGSGYSESSSRRRADTSRRSGAATGPVGTTDTTAPLQAADGGEEDDDAGDGGLFLGFEHRMNTDERRRMRERERAEAEEKQSRTRSSSPSATRAPLPSSRAGTSSTGATLSANSARYASRSSHTEPNNSKPSARRTAYTRELEKRDRQRDGRSSRTSDDRSHRGERTTGDDSSRRSERSEGSNRRRRVSSDDLEAAGPSRKDRDRDPRRRDPSGDDMDNPTRKERDRIPKRRSDNADDLETLGRRERDRSGRDHAHADRAPRQGPARERSPHRQTEKPRENKYRSKSRDGMEENDDDRRRRREDRRRRERVDQERGGVDDEEERTRRREERKRQERGGGGEYDDEERRRRREERRVREDRRTARRTTDYKSGDEGEPGDRAERDKRREERRRLREREYDDDQSLRSERQRKDRDIHRSDRDRSDREKQRRSKSSDLDVLGASDELGNAEKSSMPSRNRLVEPPSLARARTEGDYSDRSRYRDRERKDVTGTQNSRSNERLDRLAEGEPSRPKMRTTPPNSIINKGSHEDTIDSGEDEDEGVIGGSPGPSGSSSESESEEESVTQEAEEDSSEIDEEDLWTVRVCLINAVDLPFNVVPNVPLCPILKFGLVRIPAQEIEPLDPSGPETSIVLKSSNTPKFAIAEQIEKEGLLSIPKSRIRCTSGKILSKRDNGSMEFHEEMRWDDVKRPTETALAIELCARAALPPPNVHESPLAKIIETPSLAGISAGVPGGFSSISANPRNKAFPSSANPRPGVGLSGSNDDYDDIFHRAIGKKDNDGGISTVNPKRTQSLVAPNTGGGFGFMGRAPIKQEPEPEAQEEQDRGDDPDDDGSQPSSGIAGMRALWRKGRQQFEQRQAAKRKSIPDEMEAATAAAAVAKFLIGSNEGGSEGAPTSEGMASGDGTEKLELIPKRDVFRNSASLGSEPPTPPSSLAPSFGKRPLPHERNIRSGDENVALVRPKKRKKVEMAQDMRLASLVIPLTKLPLANAIDRKAAARVEQWYQLDATNNTLVPVHTPNRRGLGTASKLAARRNPSVLLEISFSAPDVLDESENELEIDSEGDQESHQEFGVLQGHMEDNSDANVSFSRRASLDMKKQQKATAAKEEAEKPVVEKKKIDDPVLEPGVCDFIAIIGAINIGDQSDDNGAKGWVNSNPECSILEQFPPNDEFHHSQKRNVTLNNKSEWFCFPEGWRLWRGAEPPSHMDLNLKRFSASSPPNVASSIAAFDACLNCTTSFSWFVLQTNEKENDFKNMKTYGACIKFYAPAPPGIDSTQDDFAQGMRGASDLHQGKRNAVQAKRLWVPLGILMTSNLPIVGTMEAMLLRLCEALASRTGGSLHSTSHRRIQQIIHQDLANLIVNFQKPIAGVLHCSIPFLTGERLHLTVPPPTGLPALPHGSSVTSVCRLLGSEGLNVLLAAVLTECKILIHSDEIANLAMVAEVITALIYPFVWSLPYLPVLPEAMIEFVEAPLSYFIGVPSCHMTEIDDSVVAEIVVIDLDNGFTSPDYYDGRRSGRQTKTPTPLPASVASNISKAVFRLLREEEEVEEEYGANNMHGTRSLPRLEAESLAEREFRIAVALQVCGLVRGYDECLFKVSASQPVFNRDKFLRTAPALFEDRRGNLSAPSGQPSTQSQKMLSPRSKRFLSILVNCQHFYQFLETLDHDECAFFNEVMYTFDMNEDKRDGDAVNPLTGYGSAKLEEAAAHLSKALQKVEDKIPTYRVDRKGKKKRRGGGGWDDDDDDDGGIEDLIETHDADHDIGFSDDGNLISSFTSDLLQQLTVDPSAMRQRASSTDGDDMTLASEMSEGRNQGAMAAQFLAEFEKGIHWDYKKLFDIPMETDGERHSLVELRDKVKLRDAIGERRYRAWKVAQEQKNADKDSTGRMFTGDITSTEGNTSLDLTSLLSQVVDDTATADTISVSTSFSSFSTQSRKMSSTLTPEQQRVQDAKDRDVLRRCLERAYEGGAAQRRTPRFARRGSGSHSQQGSDPFARGGSGSHSQPSTDLFFENGRDLIADAEAALRNPSAQKFLISVLSQRSKSENQRKRRSGADDRGRRGGTQQTLSRLEAPAFDCLVRLCGAMLDTCLENKNFEAGYNLLNQTQGFCTIQSIDGKPLPKKDAALDNANVISMTIRISLHPIFAELELWEGVLQMKLDEGEREQKDDESDSKDDVKDSDQIDYDTTVATLYEMLGFGVPSEELARFATCVSEKKGWFATERGHNLLLQARRLSAKRENGSATASSGGDWDMMRGGKMQGGDREFGSGGAVVDVDEGKLEWKIIGWCHPAAATSSRPPSQLQQEGESNAPSTSRVGQNLLNMIGNEQKKEETDVDKYLKRSAVTSLAAFGSSIVASGGLDGSVFVAHTIQFPEDNSDKEHVVRGVRLDWGSSGSRTTVVGIGSSSMDGEYGVGAVSCLAAAKGAGYRNATLAGGSSSYNTDVGGKPDDNDILQAMEGCRVVAGTTGGDLRVWSVKEVYAATALAKKGETDEVTKSMSQVRISHGGEDDGTSSFMPRSSRRGSITEIAAGSAFSRLKVSLRGRALSGHRGGVTCIDVPSHIYRPDALVTGGADGFIKLWSLRSPSGRRASGGDMLSGSSAPLFNTTNMVSGGANDPLSQTRTKGSRGGDALSILSGHTGRVLCVKTAWHGDRLLSGGADRSVRIWDLAGAGGTGKCLQELRGHLGWVTQSHYWGPNTIVSASTDRAIALWDARVRRSPLFILRYHKSPVSDLLVGSRTDPLMVSAAADGTVATWDFRTLSGSSSEAAATTPITVSSGSKSSDKKCNAVRTPASTMTHGGQKGVKQLTGTVLLSRGPGRQRRTVLSVGVDAIVREWDISSGRPVRQHLTNHVDVVSCFHSFFDSAHGSGVEAGEGAANFAGTITSSWDGTIRMRKLVKK